MTLGEAPGRSISHDFVAAEDPDQASLSNEERSERWRKNREIRDLEPGFFAW